jgi:hypothetical protein
MIILFQTNVSDKKSADRIIKTIIKEFRISEANFDLEDCDRILRIATNGTQVDAGRIIGLIGRFGYSACLLK